MDETKVLNRLAAGLSAFALCTVLLPAASMLAAVVPVPDAAALRSNAQQEQSANATRMAMLQPNA
jgi:hypothetical protein